MKSLQKIILFITALLTLFDVFGAVILLSFPQKFATEVNSASEEFGVNASIIYSIIKVESGFNSKAVSASGAIGLMQIKPSTAQYIVSSTNIFDTDYDLTDPKTNIRIGTWYIKYLLEKFKDQLTALAAYNAGEGGVRNWLGECTALNRDQIIYKETRDYVNRVSVAYKFYKIILFL